MASVVSKNTVVYTLELTEREMACLKKILEDTDFDDYHVALRGVWNAIVDEVDVDLDLAEPDSEESDDD